MSLRSRRSVLALAAIVFVAAASAMLVVACNSNPKPAVSPPTGRDSGGLPTVAAGPPVLEDVTAESGVNFSYRNGEEAKHLAILESLGGGGALIDFDGDGRLDLFVTGGGYFSTTAEEYKSRRDEYESRKAALLKEKKLDEAARLRPKDPPKIHGYPGKLYRNTGGCHFEDVTEKVFDKQPDFYSHGAAVCDYDRDGWPDLLVTGYGRVVLYHNEEDGKGGRKLVDRTEKAGLLGPNPTKLSEESGQPGEHFWSTSAAWGDLDGDGYPDLYLCQYVNWSFARFHPVCPGYTTKVDHDVCAPKEFQSRRHALWRNNRNGTFTDVTMEAGLRTVAPIKESLIDEGVKEEDGTYLGKGLGVLFVDVNGDGKPDIYVCNDTTDNFLYVNQSTPGHLKFDDRGLALGVARDDRAGANGSMGVDAADADGTGRPSIFVTNYESEFHAFYRNTPAAGRLSFTYSTSAAGLSVIGPDFVGFGTKFVDIDNDGWEDLVISNGHVVYYPPRNNLKQRPILFMNVEFQEKAQSNPVRRFADAAAKGGSFFNETHRGRGLIVGDLDNDGRADLIFISQNEPVRIVRNVASPERNWLGVELQAAGRADVVGAKLTLEVGGRKLVRFVKGGGSYLCSHDMRVLFGLGEVKKPGKLTVEWPSGEPRVQEWPDLEPNKYHRLPQTKK
jgi:enediyne biosynthesis protein E4